MKKTSMIKCLFVSALGCLTLGLVSCTNSAKTNDYNGFLDGAQESVLQGDSLLIKDIIDLVENGRYTITVTYNGVTEDITNKISWTPMELGTYVITYTINDGENKGTYTHSVEVVSRPYIVVSRDIEPEVFLYEQEISFEEFFEAQSITVSSHEIGTWEPVMISVRVDGAITTFNETQTSYKIQSLSDHFFTYAIRTLDGRERRFVAQMKVKYSFDEDTLHLNTQANGEYVIAQADIVGVKINQKQCTETEVVITENSVVFPEKMLHDKYSGINFIALTTNDGQEHRYTLNVYTESFDMENSFPDDIFYFYDFTTNAAMELAQYNGSTALKMWGSNQYQKFYMDSDYIDFVFADDTIDAFVFDFTAEFTATTGATSTMLYSEIGDKYTVFTSGETVSITLTRAEYEKWLETRGSRGTYFTFMNQKANTGTVEITWYIDNMQGVYWDVTLNQSKAAFQGVGDTVQLLATSELTGYNAVWTSANEGIATVDQTGKVTAVGYGETIITASVRGVKATCMVGLYKDKYDFEDDAMTNGVIYMGSWSTNGSMVLGEYNQSKALKLYGENQYQSFYISTGYLAWVFSNPRVKAVNIDMTLLFTSTTGVDFTLLGVGSNDTHAVYYKLFNGESTTISYTRDSYETWIANGGGKELQCAFMNQASNTGTVPLTWYMDNIQTFISPVIEDFNDKLHGNFIQPYYTSTSTNANQTASLVNGYSGETSPKWQKTVWVNGTGKSGESDDLAYLMQFENTSALSKFGISVAFLDEVFADENVTAMTWDMQCNAATVSRISTDVAQSWTSAYKAVEWVQCKMTRADYQAIKASGKQFLTITLCRDSGVANYGANPIVFFDNFSCVYAQ